MASAPSFAPSEFVDAISTSEWDYLNDKANFHPLNNWAIQGQYPPGSTFKPFTAVAALQSGLIPPATTVNHTGVDEVPSSTGGTRNFRHAGSRATWPGHPHRHHDQKPHR